ncbi:MAG: hypothetical protein RI911_242 [Candidatus Parcubacteria bacterium]
MTARATKETGNASYHSGSRHGFGSGASEQGVHDSHGSLPAAAHCRSDDYPSGANASAYY